MKSPPQVHYLRENFHSKVGIVHLLEVRAVQSNSVQSCYSVYHTADFQNAKDICVCSYTYSFEVTYTRLAPLPSQFKNIKLKKKNTALSVNRSCIIKDEAKSYLSRNGCEHSKLGGKQVFRCVL